MFASEGATVDDQQQVAQVFSEAPSGKDICVNSALEAREPGEDEEDMTGSLLKWLARCARCIH